MNWTTAYLLVGIFVLALFTGCGGSPEEKAAKRGLHAFEMGEYASARKSLERALRNRSDLREDAPLYNILGMTYAKLGEVSAATNAYLRSQQLDTNHFEAAYNLGVILCEDGQILEGARELMHAAGIRAEDTRALEYLASVYQENGMGQQARRILLAARQRNPESPRILTRLAVTGLEYEGAVYASSYLTEALRKDKKYGPARYNLGVLHDRWLKDREGAIQHYRQFLKNGGSGHQAIQAESAIARLEQEIAKDFVGSTGLPGSPEETDPAAPLGTSKPPPSPPPDMDSIQELLFFARQEVETGNPSNALNLCLQAAAMASRESDDEMEENALRTAVALCSDLPRAHFAMGRYLNERDEYRQAMQAFQKAAEIEPSWTQAHLSAADAASACNELQAALQALRKAVDLAPDNPEPLWSLGVFYDEHLKLPESAQRTFDAFVTQFEDDPRVSEARERLRILDPTPVVAPTAPALATAETTPGAGGSSSNLQHEIVHIAPPGPEPKAPQVVEPSVPSQREKAVNLFNEGARHQATGDYDKAVLFYQQAIDVDAGYAPIYYNLGLIYHQRKLLENARNAYMKATECDENLIDAHFNLALICRDLGDDACARNELEQVLKQRPNHALSHFVLGKIYAEQTGKAIDARRYFNRFLALAPNDPVAPEARLWLLQN